MADPTPKNMQNASATSSSSGPYDVLLADRQGDEAVNEEIAKPMEDPNQEVEAEEDPAESEEAKRDWEVLQEAEIRLQALPSGHPDIPKEMLSVAGHVADYYVSAGVIDEGKLIQVLEIASKAEGLAPPDDFWRGSAIYTQMRLCYTLHSQLRNIDWLKKGVKFGTEALKFMQDHTGDLPLASYQVLYSERCARLAGGYKMLYDEEKKADQIENAFKWQEQCVNATDPDIYEDYGLARQYWRHKSWCDLWVDLIDVKPDLTLSTIIHIMSENLSCSITDQNDSLAYQNFFNVFTLECRQWQHTGDPKDLEAILNRSQTLLEKEATDRTSDPDVDDYSYDPQNPQHVIRRAAEIFGYHTGINDLASQWYNHIATIDTGIGLWEHVRTGIPRKTVNDLQQDLAPICWIRDYYGRKFDITKNVTYGWRYENLDIESTNVNNIIQIFQGKEPLAEELESLTREGKGCTIGQSEVTGQMFIVWATPGTLATYTSPRLKFLTKDGDGPPTVEDWISGFSEDRKFVLGGAVEGRDDDVFKFVREYNK